MADWGHRVHSLPCLLLSEQPIICFIDQSDLEMINFIFRRSELTMCTNVVGQEQVQLSDGDIYMIGINTETRMKTIRRLL